MHGPARRISAALTAGALAVILFYHVPKTAGISVVRAARETISGVHRRVSLTEMAAWLRDAQRGQADVADVAFLSGHFGYGVHRHLPPPLQTFTFLRNPVDQTISMHGEATKRPDIYPHGGLLTLLSGGAGEPYFGNAQVRHLASDTGRPVTGPIDDRHLARAREVVVNELSCFGVTEYFAASIALLNERLQARLDVRCENASSRVAAQDLAPELLTAICDANAYDWALYDECRRVFVERMRVLGRRPLPGAC